MVPETNSQILGSYAMVDPAGRFFDDLTGTHSYSKPILEVGVEQALQQVSFDFNKFLGRGGKYNWSKNS
jgi:radical S-adenosyl methionine domain-containing protein 2